MKKYFKRSLFLLSTIVLLCSSFLAPVATAETHNHIEKVVSTKPVALEDKIDEKVKEQLAKSDEVSLIVILNEQVDTFGTMKEASKKAENMKVVGLNKKHVVRSEILTELKANAHQTQEPILELLSQEKKNGKVKEFESYYIINAVSLTGTKEIIEKLASMEEVKKIYLDEKRQLVTDRQVTVSSDDENVGWNVEQVLAPKAWELGIDGTGTVVASIDSGVQWDHPALKEKYRGYNPADGTVDHTYSFFDAVNGEEESYDDNGHGTHVTGTMVGSEPDGTNIIGVAPGAKWIAAKAFDAAGNGSDSDILAAAQWIMAPGGRVDLAPDVVNNSWSGGPGKNEWFLEVVQTWRAYGIFPVFAAGNASILRPNGPGTIANPANYPDSFAVGAVDSENALADFSFQGPSPYGEIKPEVTAPGVKIRSTLPGSEYGEKSGTSMAAPHVAGVVALLRQANASITVQEIEQILIETATPLTDRDFPKSPNNGYGYGLLNAYDAVLSETIGMGKITGNVTIEGFDDEPPVITHTPIDDVDEGTQVDLFAEVSDNISVDSVKVAYKLDDGEWNYITAQRISGDYLHGEYLATIPAGITKPGTLTYQWQVGDFAGNTVESEEYTVQVLEGITLGYFEDFEVEPENWTIISESETVNWEWGVPTSGPNEAASGEHVYATNLDGDYSNWMREMLIMPAIYLPEGEAYLQFKHWHSFEQSQYTGTPYDWGYVMASKNGRDWTELLWVTGDSDGWEEVTIDLSEYTGQGFYIGFYAYSDILETRPGWYIDDVALTATAEEALVEKLSENPVTIHTADFDGHQAQADEPESSLKLLPLEAHVSVLETGRSTVTDPQNGSYTLLHPAGEYTVLAESYGYHTQSQTVVVEDDVSIPVNFTLQEKAKGTITGVITNSLTGEPVEGVKVYLVEDANIEPAQTREDGSFELIALEGTYTLKVSHPMHYPNTVEVPVEGEKELVQNVKLPPIVGSSEVIAYDDGTAEALNYMYSAGNGWAVKMSLAEGKKRAVLTGGYYKFDGGDRPNPGGTAFLVEVYDATGPDGLPGNKIAGPFEAEAIRSHTEWTYVDLSGKEIFVEGDFYLAYIQKEQSPYTPAINRDTSSEPSGRSVSYIDGVWKYTFPSDGNYMIRAVVAYDDAIPEITSPESGQITAENIIKIEGLVTPNTDIHLFNNGEEATVVTSSEEGTFEAEVNLTEGENTITARAKQGEGLTRPSNSVKVIRDRQAPTVTILSPKDQEKFNTTTVTVQAQVEDEYLDQVTINGLEANLVDGVYEATLTLEQGENIVSVTATDKAGNETIETVSVLVDSIAPVITIETPANGEVVNKNTIEIKGKVEDDNLNYLRILQTRNIKVENNGQFTATVTLRAGKNMINIIARDSFGNEAHEQLEVIYQK